MAPAWVDGPTRARPSRRRHLKFGIEFFNTGSSAVVRCCDVSRISCTSRLDHVKHPGVCTKGVDTSTGTTDETAVTRTNRDGWNNMFPHSPRVTLARTSRRTASRVNRNQPGRSSLPLFWLQTVIELNYYTQSPGCDYDTQNGACLSALHATGIKKAHFKLDFRWPLSHRWWRLRVRPRRAPLGVDKVKFRRTRTAPPSQRPSAIRPSPRRTPRSQSPLVQNTVVYPPRLTTATQAGYPPLAGEPRSAAAAPTAHVIGGLGELLVRRGGR